MRHVVIDRASQPQPARRDWRLFVCEVFLIVSAAGMFLLEVPWPQFAWLVAAGLAGSACVRRPLRYGLVRWFELAGGAAVVTLALRAPLRMPDVGYVTPLRSELFCPPAIMACVAASLLEANRRRMILTVAFSFLALMLGGGTGLVSRHQLLLGGGLSAVYLAAMVLALNRVRAGESGSAGRGAGSRLGATLAAGCFVLVLALTPWLRGGVFSAYGYLSLQTQRLLLNRFAAVRAGRSLDLRQFVPPDFERRRKVLLRVEAEHAPGYLRGRAFEYYRHGRWLEHSRRRPLPAMLGAAEENWRRFRWAGLDKNPAARAAGPVESLRFQAASRLLSPVLFAPGRALEVEFDGDRLEIDRNASLHPDHRFWRENRGYFVRVAAGDGNSAFDGPPPPFEPADYLDLPAPLAEPVRDLARPLLRGAEGTHARLARVAEYLESGFTYALGVKTPADRDPVLHFLEETRRGHCSLFAAATVLLLRAGGVPARLVTGFVCAEQHPSGRYWVARENAAHAWAEAYLAEERRWVLVENTPAEGLPQTRRGFDPLDAFLDRLAYAWRRLLETAARGGAAAVLTMVAGAVGDFVVWIATDPRRLTAAVCGAALAWLLRVRRAERRRRRALPRDPLRRKLVRARQRLDRHLRRAGSPADPTLTLREALAALPAATESSGAERLRRFVHEYEALRFAPGAEHAAVDRLLQALRTWEGPCRSR